MIRVLIVSYMSLKIVFQKIKNFIKLKILTLNNFEVHIK